MWAFTVCVVTKILNSVSVTVTAPAAGAEAVVVFAAVEGGAGLLGDFAELRSSRVANGTQIPTRDRDARWRRTFFLRHG